MAVGVVLILEDSRTQARIVSNMFKALGWASIVTHDLSDALTQAAIQKPDLILLDAYVGEICTIHHLENFRLVRPGVPISVMTAGRKGTTIEETLTMARQARADFMIGKPFIPGDLVQLLLAARRSMEGATVPIRILVVDDSATVRHMVKDTLEAACYEVQTAETMDEVFVRIDIARLDMVITDIYMPGMGGIVGSRRISSVWPEVRIIAMSSGDGSDPEHALREALEAGATAALRKPFKPEELIALVQQVFSATQEDDFEAELRAAAMQKARLLG